MRAAPKATTLFGGKVEDCPHKNALILDYATASANDRSSTLIPASNTESGFDQRVNLITHAVGIESLLRREDDSIASSIASPATHRRLDYRYYKLPFVVLKCHEIRENLRRKFELKIQPNMHEPITIRVPVDFMVYNFRRAVYLVAY